MEKQKPKRNFEIRFYSGVVQRNPNYVDALIPLAEAYTTAGMYEQGLEIDKRLSKLCKDDPLIHYNLACSYALVGNAKNSLNTLKKAIKFGYSDFLHMKKDPDLKSIHETPEFQDLLDQLS